MNSKTGKAKSGHKHQQHQQHQSHSCASDCSCHSHSSDSGRGGAHSQEPLTISSEEKSVLLELTQCSQLPVSRFVMSSSTEKEARFVALAPVYLKALDDSMESVKQKGKVLSQLEKKGLISLNYDAPMQGYDYALHTNSALFEFFIDTINKAKVNPGFLCDTAEIEFGRMALTEFGSSQSL